MKISIFTPLGNIGNTPDYWQYAWSEALESYSDFADEVVVVWGGDKGKCPFFDGVEVVEMPWEYDFSWETIAQHFNMGLDSCTGDWIIKMDIDYIIHEKDMPPLRAMLEKYYDENWMVCSFLKFTVMNQQRAYQKCDLPFIVRGDMTPIIRFGIPTDDPSSAWGYPILSSGFDEKRGLPTGTTISNNMIRRTGIDIFNYDNTFRNKEITGKHFLRFSDARERAGFKREWGSTEEEALQKFIDMMWSRLKKTTGTYKPLNLDCHPKYIQERIKNLTPDLYGYNSWK